MALSPVGIRYTATGIRPFLASINSAKRGIAGFGATGSAAKGGLSSLGSSLSNIGRLAQSAGIGLTFFATVPIAAGIGSAVKSASEFEDSLTRLNTLSGLSQVEIDKIRQGILSLAPALGKVPTELAEAAFFITSTGDLRNAAVALDVLEASAKASAIGLGETKDVANVLTSVMAAYGQENITSSEAVDILTAAVDRGKFETEQFAPAIARVLGLASELGVGFAEASNFVATYTLSGVTASQATTALQRVMVSIIKPTAAASVALDKVGLSIQDIQSSVSRNGLTSTLLEMRKEFDAAGVPLSEFFTRVTGLTGVLFNTGEAADLFVQNLQAINGAAGIVESGFSTVSQTTSFQIAQLKSSLEVLGVTVGSTLLPVVNQLVAKIVPLVIAIADFAAQNPKIILIATAFAVLAASIGPLLLTAGFLITTLGSLVTIFGSIGAALLTLIPPVAAIVAAFLGLGTIIGSVVSKRAREANETFSSIASRALNWGKNITIQLARGLIAGAIAVVQALNQIGATIAHWLAPGSPPRLLPYLPEWGAAAMTEFADGFINADFDVFNKVADQIENVMRSIAPENDVNLVPGITNMRDVLADIVRQVRVAIGPVAKVTDETVRSIVRGFGIATGAAEDYIVTQLRLAEAQRRVEEAQEAINRVNEQYEANVAPLNKELKAIQARRDEIERQDRIAELQSIVDDANAPSLAKELALMELREIEINRQISAEQEARDAAIESLEAKLKAAEAEAKALEEQAKRQDELIKAQIKSNDLLKEQAQLLKRVADEIKNAAGGLGGGGGGGLGALDPEALDPGGFGKIKPIDFQTELTANEFAFNAEGIKGTIQGLVDEIMDELGDPISELSDAWVELGDTWSETFSAIRETWDGVVGFFQDNGETILNWIYGVASAIGAFKIGTIIASIVGFFSTLAGSIAAFAGGGGIAGIIYGLAGAFDAAVIAVGGLVAAIGGPVTIVIGIIAALIGLFVVAWRENWFGIQEIVKNAWTNIQAGIETLRTWWVGTAWPAITNAVSTAWETISGIFQSIVSWVQTNIVPVIQDLWTRWSEAWDNIKLGLSNAWIVISTTFAEIGRWINDNIIPWVEFFATLWATKWQNIKDDLDLAWIAIETVWIAAKEWLETTLTKAVESLQTAWETAWGLIQVGFMVVWDVIRPVWEKIKEWLEDTFPSAADTLKGAWDIAFSTLGAPVNIVKDAVEALLDAATRFWEWLTSHDFSFNISIPDLPEWAVPGSPLPIHTAWKNFADEFSGKVIEMAVAPTASIPAPSVSMPLGYTAGAGGSQQSNQIGPNYINNGMDEAVFAERVRRVVAGDL